MEKKINIAEILKDCPKGVKLYSPLLGEVELSYLINGNRSISVSATNRSGHKAAFIFSEYGVLITDYDDAECLLFPSKDCRDWSKFEAPKPNK